MSYLTEFQDLADELLDDFGTTCTVTNPGGTWDTDGSVTETPTNYTSIPCSDLVAEVGRYMPSVTGRMASATIYLSGSIAFTPAVGWRVTYQSRVYHVVACMPFRLQAGVAAWQLDLFDQGAS